MVCRKINITLKLCPVTHQSKIHQTRSCFGVLTATLISVPPLRRVTRLYIYRVGSYNAQQPLCKPPLITAPLHRNAVDTVPRALLATTLFIVRRSLKRNVASEFWLHNLYAVRYIYYVVVVSGYFFCL